MESMEETVAFLPEEGKNVPFRGVYEKPWLQDLTLSKVAGAAGDTTFKEEVVGTEGYGEVGGE